MVPLVEAISSLSRRPGLLLGSAATRAPGDLGIVLRQAFKSRKFDDMSVGLTEENYGSYIDRVGAEQPAKAPALEAEIRNGILATKPAPDINHLVRTGWSACVSITEDLTFEAALRAMSREVLNL